MGERKSNRTAAGVRGNFASTEGALQGHSGTVRADGVRRGANRCWGGRRAGLPRGWALLAGGTITAGAGRGTHVSSSIRRGESVARRDEVVATPARPNNRAAGGIEVRSALKLAL